MGLGCYPKLPRHPYGPSKTRKKTVFGATVLPKSRKNAKTYAKIKQNAIVAPSFQDEISRVQQAEYKEIAETAKERYSPDGGAFL